MTDADRSITNADPSIDRSTPDRSPIDFPDRFPRSIDDERRSIDRSVFPIDFPDRSMTNADPSIDRSIPDRPRPFPPFPRPPEPEVPSRPLPARRFQDGGAGAEGFGAALPPGPAGTRPQSAPGGADGHDGAGGDEEILGEERALGAAPVPPRQHLQVVPAHGHVHHPPRHRRRPQPRCVPVLAGRSPAPGAVPSLPGSGEGPGPWPRPPLLGQVRPGPAPELPHLERDPAPGVGPWPGAASPAGVPVGGAGAGPDPAVLGRPGLPVTGNSPGKFGNSHPAPGEVNKIIPG